MNYLQIALLALIQGAAELLPVSSSAHVILVAKLMGQDPSKADFVFLLLMLHTGTMFAVILYFWPRWRKLIRPEKGSPWRFPGLVALATVCTLILGYVLKTVIEKGILGTNSGESAGVETLFKNLTLMAVSLLAVGILIIVAGFLPTRKGDVSPETAICLGLIQGVCLIFRGFSRSGATISLALMRGVSRPLAEDFSFALGVAITPFALADRALKLSKLAGQGEVVASDVIVQGLVGMVFSFLAGLVALRFLSSVLENGRWAWFGYYCLIFAAVVYLAAMQGL
jgi:undecaprenyl-diphosphatase